MTSRTPPAPGTPAPPPVRAGVPGQRTLRAVTASMPEDGPEGVEWHLRKYIKDLRALGGIILTHHDWKEHAKRTAQGWPDWFLLGPGGVIVRELKRENTHPTKAQQEWLDYLCKAGIDAGVWRPSDVVSGRMITELQRIAGLGGGA